MLSSALASAFLESKMTKISKSLTKLTLKNSVDWYSADECLVCKKKDIYWKCVYISIRKKQNHATT